MVVAGAEGRGRENGGHIGQGIQTLSYKMNKFSGSSDGMMTVVNNTILHS